jgi:hypothetical protein
MDRFGCLANLTRVLRGAGLTITRAKVRTFAADRSSGHTFYVMARDPAAGVGGAGGDGLVPPDRVAVQAACAAAGGHLADSSEQLARSAAASSGAGHAFSYSFLSRRAAGGARSAAGGPAGSGGGGGMAPGVMAAGGGWLGGPAPAGGGGMPTARPRVGSLTGASPDSDGSF